jgi:CDP-glycerol glycerophosphotransferase (TagB/SpsB family)
MRIGFLPCNKFHEAILRPIHERLRRKHWCLYTENREALFDFQPHVVIMAEAIFGELRPRLPETIFVHTRHGLASKMVAYQGANECDYLCVTSDFMRDWYRQGGAKPRGDFWVIGYVGLDPLFRGDTPALPFQRKPGQKIVLYAPTFNLPFSSASMLGDRLVELIRGSRQDISIMIKPHPLIAEQSPEWMETWRRLVRDHEDVHLATDANEDVMPYLRAADALVTDASSVQLYYLALDRPMILINNPDRFNCEYFDARGFEWSWRDMGRQIDNVEELPSAVSTALSDPQSNGDRRAHYRRLLFDDLTDGRAVERLCQNVEALAAAAPSDHLSYLASVPAARLAARKVKWAARRAAQEITRLCPL